MFVPIPKAFAVSLAIASASPVTILIFTPMDERGRNRGLCIFARRIEHGQHAEKLPQPVALGPRHAQRTKTARGKIIDRFFRRRLH